VEWGFGKVLNDWPYPTQKMAHKLGVSPVGLVYWCAVLLSNVKCCLVAERECDGRGSATAKLFDDLSECFRHVRQMGEGEW